MTLLEGSGSERSSCFMSEENKAVARREIEELFARGNLDAAEEIYAPNYVGHEPTSGDIRGIEGAKQFAATYRQAFPDLQPTVEDQVAEGDKVVTRFSARAPPFVLPWGEYEWWWLSGSADPHSRPAPRQSAPLCAFVRTTKRRIRNPYRGGSVPPQRPVQRSPRRCGPYKGRFAVPAPASGAATVDRPLARACLHRGAESGSPAVPSPQPPSGRFSPPQPSPARTRLARRLSRCSGTRTAIWDP